jgi:hypothetical protein
LEYTSIKKLKTRPFAKYAQGDRKGDPLGVNACQGKERKERSRMTKKE